MSQGYSPMGDLPGEPLVTVCSNPRRLTTPLTTHEVPHALLRSFFYWECQLVSLTDGAIELQIPTNPDKQTMFRLLCRLGPGHLVIPPSFR